MSEDKFKRLLDASSFGTPEAKAAMASVPQERVDKVLARVEELRRESAGAEMHGRITQVFIPGRRSESGSYLLECRRGRGAGNTDRPLTPISPLREMRLT